MTRLAIRRMLVAVVTAAAISLVTFVLLHARTEEALRLQAERLGVFDREGIATLRDTYGLNRSVPARLGAWLRDAVTGDFGRSWSHPGQSVREVLASGLPLTLALTGTGLILQILIGLVVGAVAMARQRGWSDLLISALAAAVHAIPEFSLGLLLVWPFSVRLGWFPLSGAASEPWALAPDALPSPGDLVWHLTLPALCLGLGGGGMIARLVQVRWREEHRASYAVAARARGVPERRILWWHGLRGAAGPLCTTIGLSFPALVGGAVVVEYVFNWPGLGSVLVEAVASRDLPILAAVNVVLALLVTVGGALSDLLWMAIDPRARTA